MMLASSAGFWSEEYRGSVVVAQAPPSGRAYIVVFLLAAWQYASQHEQIEDEGRQQMRQWVGKRCRGQVPGFIDYIATEVAQL